MKQRNKEGSNGSKETKEQARKEVMKEAMEARKQ